MLAFVNIGLVPDGGASLFVPARIGFARAAEMALLGEPVTAAKAVDIGLINAAWPDEEFDEARRGPAASGSATARPAPTRAPSGSSTTGSTPAWPSTWPSRPIQGELARARTSSRASPPSSESAPPFTGESDWPG